MDGPVCRVLLCSHQKITWMLPRILVVGCTGSVFEAVAILPPAIAHGIAILAHTLREGFTVHIVKSYWLNP
jgi:hypothetical protein